MKFKRRYSQSLLAPRETEELALVGIGPSPDQQILLCDFHYRSLKVWFPSETPRVFYKSNWHISSARVLSGSLIALLERDRENQPSLREKLLPMQNFLVFPSAHSQNESDFSTRVAIIQKGSVGSYNEYHKIVPNEKVKGTGSSL